MGKKAELVDLIKDNVGKIGSFTLVTQGYAHKYKKKEPFRPSPPSRLDHALCDLVDPLPSFVEDG